ncbi:MAG TPA: efflux RND transporter periplasmic adaptor subunit [Candidatus Acidoferrum sp.]|nr:efflux RND transporter periplasmic adaptor subunit [Candidatus Acidoferrum sp.]
MKKTISTLLLVGALAAALLAGGWSHERPGAPASPAILQVRYDRESAPPGSVTVRPELQQLLGVQVRPVAKTAGAHSLRLLGRVVPEETRVYKVNAGIEGLIREVAPVTTGDHVQTDQLLATFSSPSSYNIIQLYILNLGSVDRIQQRAATGSVEAEAAPAGNANLQQRVDQMENLGMSARQMAEVRRTRQVPASIEVRAPAAGVVLERSVTPGLKFDRGMELYRIADLSRVWIVADVFEHDAQALLPGQTVTVTLPGQSRSFPATVSAVRPTFDPVTRTLKVRLEAANPDDRLRPDMFVDITVPVRVPPTLAVPAEALLEAGLQQTVFVERRAGVFEPRAVTTGARFGDQVEITQGLAPGERIVVAGTFLLDSESRMQRAGAGATGHQHHAPLQAATSPGGPAAATGSPAHMHGGQMQAADSPSDATPPAAMSVPMPAGHKHPSAMVMEQAQAIPTAAVAPDPSSPHSHSGHSHGEGQP